MLSLVLGLFSLPDRNRSDLKFRFEGYRKDIHANIYIRKYTHIRYEYEY